MNKAASAILLSVLVVMQTSRCVYAQEARADGPKPSVMDHRAIDREIAECLKELREIVRDADASIKKIDKEARSQVIKEESKTKKSFITMQWAVDESAEKAKLAVWRKSQKESAEAAEKTATRKAEVEASMAKLAHQKRLAEAEKKITAPAHVPSEKETESKASAPAMAETRTMSAQASLIAKEIPALYQDAVDYYWENKYGEARARFEQIQKLSPDYARTKYYLNRLQEKTSSK